MRLTDCAHDRKMDASSRKFVVTLNVADGCDPEVRSSELIGRGYRNRTSFGENAQLYDVFITEIADKLMECLSSIGVGTEVVSFQDLVIEAPGLTLSGAHMLVKRDENGTLHIIFRFQFFLGSLDRAFRKSVGLGDCLEDENRRLASLVMSDLALPILNLCEAAKMGMLASELPLSIFGDRLVERADEIVFQIELIKRFIKEPEIALTRIGNRELEVELRHEVPTA